MLLAIDVGNTHTVYGLWDGERWRATWRRGTNPAETEDEIASWLGAMFSLAGIPYRVESAVCGSVVPAMNDILDKLCDRYLDVGLRFLSTGLEVGLPVSYDPPNAVGADRLANALGALARYEPPIIVVDFGTATTFDVIDASGVYVGGAILPGVNVSAEALAMRTAKLPRIEYRAPSAAIGKNTVQSLQSGLMLGYAGSIDALATRITQELGGRAKVIATGGLGAVFLGLAKSIESYEPTLTLEGLVIAHDRMLV